MWKEFVWLAFICTVNSFAEAKEEILCKDEDGNVVDW